jgi:hypothetical protein
MRRRVVLRNSNSWSRQLALGTDSIKSTGGKLRGKAVDQSLVDVCDYKRRAPFIRNTFSRFPTLIFPSENIHKKPTIAVYCHTDIINLLSDVVVKHHLQRTFLLRLGSICFGRILYAYSFQCCLLLSPQARPPERWLQLPNSEFDVSVS